MSGIWYRQPYVWMIIFFPALAVVGGIATIIMAIHSNDGLVADDYYKQGMQINRSLARDKAALLHGLTANLKLDMAAGKINLQLEAKPEYLIPAQLTLNFAHSTRAGFDRQVEIQASGGNTYQGDMEALPVGIWHIQLSAGDWRLQGRLSVPANTQLIMDAGH